MTRRSAFVLPDLPLFALTIAAAAGLYLPLANASVSTFDSEGDARFDLGLAESPAPGLGLKPTSAKNSHRKKSERLHVEAIGPDRVIAFRHSTVDVYDFTVRMGAASKHRLISPTVLKAWRHGKSIRYNTDELVGSHDGIFKGGLERHAVALRGLAHRLAKHEAKDRWMVSYQKQLRAAGFGRHRKSPRALRAIASRLEATAQRLRDKNPGSRVVLVSPHSPSGKRVALSSAR